MSELRHRLILGKFQVTKIERGLTGLKFHVRFGPITMTIDSPISSDVQVGDLLTFYTEVLHADAGSASVQ